MVPGDRIAKEAFGDWLGAAFGLSTMLSSLTIGNGILVSHGTSVITANQVITCGGCDEAHALTAKWLVHLAILTLTKDLRCEMNPFECT